MKKCVVMFYLAPLGTLSHWHYINVCIDSFSHLMFSVCCRFSGEIGKGNTSWESWTAAAHSEKDVNHHAGKLFLSSTDKWSWSYWTYGQVRDTSGAQSWQQVPWLQEFTVQGHRSEGNGVNVQYVQFGSIQFNLHLWFDSTVDHPWYIHLFVLNLATWPINRPLCVIQIFSLCWIALYFNNVYAVGREVWSF